MADHDESFPPMSPIPAVEPIPPVAPIEPIEPLSHACALSVPAGMTAEKLRLIAGWLDTYDRLAAAVVSNVHVADAEVKADALVAVSSSEIQDELRYWADAIDELS